MRTIVLRTLTGVVILALAVLAAPVGAAGETPEQELPSGQARVVIAVEGMSCGGCCVKVETALNELAGVVDTNADYEKGMATVTYVEDKVSVTTIVETINSETSFKATMPEKKT